MYSYACILILMPAYLQKDYSTISYFSGVFTAFSIAAILIVISYDCILISDNRRTENVPDIMWMNLSALPIFLGQTCVLFEGNCSLLNIYAEHRYPREMMRTTVHVHIVLAILTLMTGVLSYYAFGDSLSEIIIYDLPEKMPFTILTQIFYMLNVMGCFVIMSQVIFILVEKTYELSNWQFYLYRILFVQLIFVLTLIFPDVNVVLSLFAGSICSCALMVLPVFFWRKAYIVDAPAERRKDRGYQMMGGWIIVVIIMSISVFGIVQNILEMTGLSTMTDDLKAGPMKSKDLNANNNLIQ